MANLFAQVKENEIYLRDKAGLAKVIKFKETRVSDEHPAINIFLKSQYGVGDEIEFRTIKSVKTDKLGFKVEKLQQYYKNVKVEFGIFNAISKNGELQTTSGNYLPIKKLNTTPSLTETEALQFALKYIGAVEYIWENQSWEQLFKEEKNDLKATYYPKGELVILEKVIQSGRTEPVLAYKFDIYSSNPISRAYYYIDASNGKTVLVDAILKHIEGIANTRYSGQRTIETEQVGTQFRLRDNVRGNGICTLNANHVFFGGLGNINLNGVTEFVDNNNNWTDFEFNNANVAIN